MAKKLLSTVLPSRFDKYDIRFPEDWDIKYLETPYTNEQMIEALKDREYLFVGAIHPVNAEVIRANPQLKLIQSEELLLTKLIFIQQRIRYSGLQ